MNKIVLIGRFVRDPELKHIEETNRAYCKFTIAVQRNYKASNGDRECDFIPVIIFGRKAETICKYNKKGDSISISGRLEIKKIEDSEGNKKYLTDVIADDFNFISTSTKQSVNE